MSLLIDFIVRVLNLVPRYIDSNDHGMMHGRSKSTIKLLMQPTPPGKKHVFRFMSVSWQVTCCHGRRVFHTNVFHNFYYKFLIAFREQIHKLWRGTRGQFVKLGERVLRGLRVRPLPMFIYVWLSFGAVPSTHTCSIWLQIIGRMHSNL